MTVATRAVLATTLPTTQPRFRLRRRARRIALTAHVLGSVGWFGIAVVVVFCGLAAAATNDPTLTRALYRTMETVPWLSVPVGLVAVATGALLGLGTTYGLVRHWWVVAKIVIAVAVIVTDAVLVARVAHDAAVTGAATAPLYGSTIAHVVVLAVATVLSVFKPRARTPWGQRDLAQPTARGTAPRPPAAVAAPADAARAPDGTRGRGTAARGGGAATSSSGRTATPAQGP